MVALNHSSAPPDRVLEITRIFNAPRALVFAAWTKAEHLVNWFGPKDFTLSFCETDFREGGKYKFCMRSPEGVDFWVWGIYREIIEPERLVFTWERDEAAEWAGAGTVVTLTFLEHQGKTTFNLHQAIFSTTTDRDEHNGGWTSCFDRLDEYVRSLHV